MSGGVPAVELVGACSSGDVQLLYELLSQQQSGNLTSEGGVSLLMHTIIGAGTTELPTDQYKECCSLLIQGGAELEISDTTYGRTAAHWAVYYHRDDILTVLIEAGSDMTCPDFTGTSPFHLAIQESAMTCLIAALQLLPQEILQIPHPQFLLPLLHAVQYGNMEACQILVRAGVDVNQVDERSGQSALHLAAEFNDRMLVDFLIRCGGLLDVIDGRGLTPLHIACIVEGKDALEAIVKRVGGGEVLDIRDEQGLTPLMHSCLYGNVDSVRLLLKKKADLMEQDLEGKTCLHYAAESSSETAHDCAQLIMKKEKQLLEMTDEFGRIPLYSCAASGTAMTLDLLISSGSSVQDSSQRRLVHWAAVSGNHAVLSKLIEMGCGLDVPDSQGSTPLHYACRQSAAPGKNTYTEEADVKSCLVQQCVGLLLEGGAAVDCRDAHGLMPLHYAVQHANNLETIHILLSHGADPNDLTGGEGMTSLHLAARGGVVDSCQFLLERTGGHIGTLVDSEGHTALHHAAGSGSLECVNLLLQAGISPDQTNNSLRSAAHIAASAGSTQCLQLLNDYGGNLGMSSADGTTPLHEAAASGYADVVEFLLSNDTSSMDKGSGVHKATPLHYAVQEGHAECVQILLNWGAKVNAIAISEEGEHLSALDLCDNTTSIIYDNLIQFGALPGTEVAKQQQVQEESKAESAVQEEEEEVPEGSELSAEDEPISIPGVRPVTPSRRSFVDDPIFEDDREEYTPSPQQLSRVPTHATHPPPPPPPPPHPVAKRQGMGTLKKSSHQNQDSSSSSVTGLFAAQDTMVTAAIIGGKVGEETATDTEKVAMDTAEELEKTAAKHEGEFPELLWLHKEVDGLRTPTLTPPSTSPPPTHPPPIPKVQEDPYERRMRKARAQLDMSKSKGFLAVEELVKAQHTHTKLKRQFHEDKLRENIQKMRENFHEKEMREEIASKKVMEIFEGKMNRAEAESEELNKVIDDHLSEAHEENEKLSTMMGKMGVHPRPTVAQWLQRKQMQKKAALQDTMIHWDRARRHREAAILVEHQALSHRALRHAAWGAKKELGSKIKAINTSPYQSPTSSLPPVVRGRSSSQETGGKKSPRFKPSPTRALTYSPPSPIKSDILPTSTRFRKIRTRETSSRITTPTHQKTTPSNTAEPLLWKIGEDYVVKDKVPHLPSHFSSTAFIRATGPKTLHAEKTLHFMLPEDYRASKEAERTKKVQLNRQHGYPRTNKAVEGHRSPSKSTLTIRSLDFEQTKPGVLKEGVSLNRTSLGSAKYHSHTDNINGSGLYPRLQTSKRNSDMPAVLAMKIIDSPSMDNTHLSPMTAS